MAEAASASVGPRYAPDDPTLPEPWKGLIDGSTGVLYYWNPLTNVTQYEKPSAAPLSSTTPKLASIPVPSTGKSHQAQSLTQPHQTQQMPQQMSQQFTFQQNKSAIQPHGHPMQEQAYQQMPQQQIMQHQNSPAPQQQGNQYTHPQVQNMGYQQQFMSPQGHQSSQQATQQFPSQQEYKAGAWSTREGTEAHSAKQISMSQSHLQNSGVSASQNIPFDSNSGQIQRTGAAVGQVQQYNQDPRINMQHSSSMGQFQQAGANAGHQQHGHGTQNHRETAMMPKNSNGPYFGTPQSYDNNLYTRPGNDSFPNTRKERPAMPPQHPNLAGMPMELSVGERPVPSSTHTHAGKLDAAMGHAMHGHYSQTGPPFPNNPMLRPPFLESPDANLSPVEAYLRQHEVTVTGENVPAPFISFEATGFPPELLKELLSAGFASPTPIQAQTWPIALQSRDIVAIAKTGSGKTLGYLIPAFMLLRHCRNNAQNGPTVLVLSPTRELATQIQDEALRFGRSLRLSCTCLYGGAPKGPQLKELERGADIVVATPGRLNDILEMKKIDFRQVSLLVLDEADRMLDMGFEPQIRKIVNEIPPRRQTLMYTATWPKEVRKIAGDLLVNPVQVNIGNTDELAANKSITQYVEVVPQMQKERRLEQILRSQERGSKVIIFCSTKKLCDHLARSVGRSFGAVVIHGDKSQGERDWVLNQFRSGKSTVLIATDVAARGLDIKDIRIVINYDFPTGIEDYVHRIGRTGRAGATGISYTFLSDQDWKYAPDLIKLLEGANQQVPPEVREIASRGGPGFSKDRGIVNRFDSGGSRWDSSGGRDGGFRGRGGHAGRGGFGMREDSFGRGNRGGGFGRGPGFGHVNGGRNDRGGMHGRGGYMDGRNSRGRGFERGGRFDSRGAMNRSRGRNYSRSPEMVRTWHNSRSPSRSRSRSPGRSYSRSRRSRSYSRSRSRSWSRSRSRSSPRYSRERGRSRSRSLSRSPSPSPRRPERRFRSGFDVKPVESGFDVKPSESGFDVKPANSGVVENQIPEQGATLGTHENRLSEDVKHVE